MKVENLNKGAREIGRRNAALYIMLGLSVSANLALSIGIIGARQTILVPTLTNEMTLRGGGIGREYLEMLARDATFVFLNRSPQTEEFFDRQVERMTLPATYREIRQALLNERVSRSENRASQVFYPSTFYVDPSDLYVEVTGKLETLNTREVIKSEDKAYGLTFERQGSMVLLASFVPLKPDEQRGAKVQPRKQEAEVTQ